VRAIPIRAAQAIAEQFGYSQVIVVARAVGRNGGEHVTTYGIDKANCGIAATIGRFFKHKLMGWPTNILCAGCNQSVQEDWTYCPYCGAQGRAGVVATGEARTAAS
jgi:hypothetical protein